MWPRFANREPYAKFCDWQHEHLRSVGHPAASEQTGLTSSTKATVAASPSNEICRNGGQRRRHSNGQLGGRRKHRARQKPSSLSPTGGRNGSHVVTTPNENGSTKPSRFVGLALLPLPLMSQEPTMRTGSRPGYVILLCSHHCGCIWRTHIDTIAH